MLWTIFRSITIIVSETIVRNIINARIAALKLMNTSLPCKRFLKEIIYAYAKLWDIHIKLPKLFDNSIVII